MKPKMPPAKFIKKSPGKSEEKTESKKEKAAEKKNPALEIIEKAHKKSPAKKAKKR